MLRTKRSYHQEKFQDCSYGTKIALISEVIFDSERYRMGRTGFTNPKCKIMLDEYLSNRIKWVKI